MPSILQALGVGAGRSSPHQGSKRGFTHVSDPAADPQLAIARAQEWSQATGRPVPPHLRPRAPLLPTVPLGSRDRWDRYTRVNHAKRLTPAQSRRMRHKHGRREVAVLLAQAGA